MEILLEENKNLYKRCENIAKRFPKNSQIGDNYIYLFERRNEDHNVLDSIYLHKYKDQYWYLLRNNDNPYESRYILDPFDNELILRINRFELDQIIKQIQNKKYGD